MEMIVSTLNVVKEFGVFGVLSLIVFFTAKFSLLDFFLADDVDKLFWKASLKSLDLLMNKFFVLIISIVLLFIQGLLASRLPYFIAVIFAWIMLITTFLLVLIRILIDMKNKSNFLKFFSEYSSIIAMILTFSFLYSAGFAVNYINIDNVTQSDKIDSSKFIVAISMGVIYLMVLFTFVTPLFKMKIKGYCVKLESIEYRIIRGMKEKKVLLQDIKDKSFLICNHEKLLNVKIYEKVIFDYWKN